jgi:hypothetical protein
LEKFTTITGADWKIALTRAREYRKVRDKQLKEFIKEKNENMRQLKDLTKEEYFLILSTGMLRELHPDSTGNYAKDCLDVEDKKEEDEPS